MKLKGLNLIAASLMLCMPLCVSAAIPATPSITSPNNGEQGTSRDLGMIATPLTAGAGTLVESSWLVYRPVTQHQFFGGLQRDDNLGFTDFNNEYQDIPYTLETTIEGQAAKFLRIWPYGKAQLLDQTKSTILAQVMIQPDELADMKSSREDSLIAVRTFDNAMVVSWYLEDNDGSIDWTAQLQAIFIDSGRVGFKSSINNFNDDFFTLSSGDVGCLLKNGAAYGGFNNHSLSSIKTFLINNNINEFSLFCDKGESGVGGGGFPSSNVEAIEIPEFIYEISSTNGVSLDKPLRSNTAYRAQVRYKVDDGADTIWSHWSDTIRFTTGLPDTDYVFALPTNLDFTAGVSQTLSFTVTNEGGGTGNPIISVRLPFNPLTSNFNSSNFRVNLDDGTCSPLNISGGTTTLSCILDELAPNTSATLQATFALPSSVSSIEYRACDDGDCNNVAYQTLPVSVAANTNGGNNGGGSNNGGSSSSSSSGGGSSFGYLLLLMLPALLLRRKKH